MIFLIFSHFDLLVRYLSFLRKRKNTNPKKGPLHFRAPSKILWRVIRGMVPHKTARGKAALAHLKVFEGVPPPYDKEKRMVVPQALRALRLDPSRPYTVLGRLSSEVGWKYKDVVTKLEEKRKVRSEAFYQRRKALLKLRSQAIENSKEKISKQNTLLESYGYLNC